VTSFVARNGTFFVGWLHRSTIVCNSQWCMVVSRCTVYVVLIRI